MADDGSVPGDTSLTLGPGLTLKDVQDPLPPDVTEELVTEPVKPPGPPPFTLDEAEGEEEHDGHTRTFHAEEPPGTAAGLAAEAKALFDSLLQNGFERNDALELVKEMIRMTYFPDHAAKK